MDYLYFTFKSAYIWHARKKGLPVGQFGKNKRQKSIEQSARITNSKTRQAGEKKIVFFLARFLQGLSAEDIQRTAAAKEISKLYQTRNVFKFNSIAKIRQWFIMSW